MNLRAVRKRERNDDGIKVKENRMKITSLLPPQISSSGRRMDVVRSNEFTVELTDEE